MNYTRTVLDNGLRLITVPIKDNPTVTVMVLVEAGSKYETKDKNGISHFLEHMCFKGTERRPNNSDISSELDSLGSVYNAYTSDEKTCYFAKAEARHLDKILDVVSDMYLHPIFDEKEIEKEKGVIIEEINMYEDLPQRKVQLVFMDLLYGDQPAGWDIAGPKENIRGMSREDFLNYRSKFYGPKATAVVVVGNFDEAKVKESISKIFGDIATQPKGEKIKTIERQNQPQIKIFHKDTDQTHLVLGVRTFDTYDKRTRILDVLTGVLSGGMSARLFKKLRDEMGICYYVRAEADDSTDTGVLTVSAGVDNKRVREAITAIMEELKRLKDELVSPSELQKIKQHLMGTLTLGLESSDELASFYGGQEIENKPIKRPEEIKEEIEAVTAEEIKKLAGEIFVNKGLNLAIVGRFTDPTKFLDLLTF